jgi:dTDP-4-amino-4,6-dideoxygalactose transaminase
VVLRLVAQKLRRARRYVYDVPWCVPQWGAVELWTTARALATARISRGSDVERFAAALRQLLGVPYVVPTSMGRVAIELGLRALGVGQGHDVVLPSYVCASVAEAVARVRARAVYADVGPDLNVTAATIAAALTPATWCVIVPHLFGRPACIDAIEALLAARGIPLMDDAAQALGARVRGRPVGSFGSCGIVSCGPGKPLAGAAGGALVTADPGVYHRASAIALASQPAGQVLRRVAAFWWWRRLRRLSLPLEILARRLGRRGDDEQPWVGGALANLDAAIALAQLARLERHRRERRDNARYLLRQLGPAAAWSVTALGDDAMVAKLALILPPEGPDVTEAVDRLAEAGIECQGGYTPCHLRDGANGRGVTYTEAVWQRVLCIPVERRARRDALLRRAVESLM